LKGKEGTLKKKRLKKNLAGNGFSEDEGRWLSQSVRGKFVKILEKKKRLGKVKIISGRGSEVSYRAIVPLGH